MPRKRIRVAIDEWYVDDLPEWFVDTGDCFEPMSTQQKAMLENGIEADRTRVQYFLETTTEPPVCWSAEGHLPVRGMRTSDLHPDDSRLLMDHYDVDCVRMVQIKSVWKTGEMVPEPERRVIRFMDDTSHAKLSPLRRQTWGCASM